ncbi:hypothetical protein UAW_03010 [Enterococcus haemoperoxidus ATCC BAA-382]|uniref:WxL domain-containing protein n=1 Tax=Enterococcus haemoperoxidus ATCC BAA-382 TaxID=1158608 RepID=R2SAG6_9ENTE|nr:WxL domain-containing protein [Enterococcus haemoperoxidus]EOH92490.1 hypothetical protein UAW_03010 [Enterococcus haemoperoxidus ATCC BAA-382]EOT61711.1 hypothetical protein I583_00693 [Enterococcus haemoperoxidus ATCC BAA-382]OJG51823.1 hypothetical protein RV06_GL001515 [Enterococcus haemoperoxidus]
MKKTTILMGLTLTATLLVTGHDTYAETPTEKTTMAEIEVLKSGGIEPGKPEEPEEPIGPGIGTGDFTINAVSDFKFGQIKMGQTGKAQVEADKKLGIEVIDERGTGSGWNVQVSMTNFSSTINGNQDTIVKGWGLFIPKGEVSSKQGDMQNPPTSRSVVINSASVNETILTADKDKGMGRYTSIFMDDKTTDLDKSIRLVIPSYAKVGQYKAELTWSLINGPVK